MIVKKAESLLVPYFIFLIPVLFYNVGWWLLHQDVSFRDVVETSSIHNDPLWFLFSLFLMNAIFIIVVRAVIVGGGKCRSINMLCLVLLSLLLACVGFAVRRCDWINFKWSNALEYMPYFTLGYVWRQSGFDVKNTNWIFAVCVVFVYLAVAAPYQLSASFHGIANTTPIYFIGALSGSFVVIWLCSLIGRSSAVGFVGKNSLAYLALHQYMLFVAARGFHITNPWLILIFTLIAVGVLSTIINRYLPWMLGRRLPNIFGA